MPALLVFSASPFVFHTTKPLKVPHHRCLPLPSMWLFEVSQCPPCPSQRGHGRVAWGTSLLQYCEDSTSEVLLSPANTGSSQGWRNSGVSLLGTTKDLNLLKRTESTCCLPQEPLTQDLQAGLLTAQCVLAAKNPTQINKERNSILLQYAQRPGLVWGCAYAPSQCRDSLHASRGGLGMDL